MALFNIFFIFAKIGLFTIGGGYAMIPLIQQELVANGFLSIEEITNIIAISEMTPGPFAVNAATFVGMKLYGIPGALVCTLGVISPSLVIMTLVARFFFNINKKPVVQSILYGVRPVVWALILYATLTVARSAFIGADSALVGALPTSVDIPCVLLFAVVFVCMLRIKKVSPIVFIFSAGVFGAIFLRP